jgi:hypothetical protein
VFVSLFRYMNKRIQSRAIYEINKRVKYLRLQTPQPSANGYPHVCHGHYLHPIKADGLFDHPSRYPNNVSGIDFHDPLQPNRHKAYTINKCAKPIALAYAPGLNRRKQKSKSIAKQSQTKFTQILSSSSSYLSISRTEARKGIRAVPSVCPCQVHSQIHAFPANLSICGKRVRGRRRRPTLHEWVVGTCGGLRGDQR